MFCHGTPRDDEEVVLVDTLLSRWREILDAGDPLVTTFDVEAACAAVISSGCPDAAAWAESFIRSPADDAQALTAFAPRDGRSLEAVRR
jgi:hypothetical protein